MSEDNNELQKAVDNVIPIDKHKKEKERAESRKIMESILKRPTCTVNLEENNDD